MSADDFVYEVGTVASRRCRRGASRKKAGDIVEIDARPPRRSRLVRLLVKLVREKVLPEANDEWASDASEFDTFEELRNESPVASRA